MRTFLLVLATTLLIAACGGSSGSSDPTDDIEGSWQLTEGRVEGETVPIIDDHPITITFDGVNVSGTAACNGYGGVFERSGSSISFPDLAITEMACFPPEVMDAEQLFARGLTLVDTVSGDGDLSLTGSDVEMTFAPLEPVPDAELTNTVWVLDGLIQGDSVSTPVLDTRATIEFFTDGSVLGDTGCRPFSGHYAINGAEVVMTDLAAEGQECEPELADQDSHVITAIEGTIQVEIEGDRLTISSRGGDGLTFRAES